MGININEENNGLRNLVMSSHKKLKEGYPLNLILGYYVTGDVTANMCMFL
jgi:hypothetical protein